MVGGKFFWHDSFQEIYMPRSVIAVWQGSFPEIYMPRLPTPAGIRFSGKIPCQKILVLAIYKIPVSRYIPNVPVFRTGERNQTVNPNDPRYPFFPTRVARLLAATDPDARDISVVPNPDGSETVSGRFGSERFAIDFRTGSDGIEYRLPGSDARQNAGWADCPVGVDSPDADVLDMVRELAW